jgi:hypothetical protein
MMEIELIHRCRDTHAVSVPLCGDSRNDVDPVHKRAAEQIPEPVRIVGQDELGGDDL